MTIPPVSFSPYQYNFNLRKNNYIEKKQLNNFSPIAFKNSMDFDTVDGIIGNFKQGKIADCYILSALISLANTEIGAEIARATGANGGGRPNFAQGGVKDASKLDEILAKIETDIKG